MKVSALRFVQKIAGEGGVRVLSAVFIFLLARHLGPAGFGDYSALFSILCIATLFVDLGMNPVLTRDLARAPVDRQVILGTSHTLKALASCVFMLGTTLVSVFFYGWTAAIWIPIGLSVAVCAQTLTEYYSALLAGREEMGWEALLKAGTRFFTLAGAIVFLLQGAPLSTLVACMAAGSLVGIVYGELLVRGRFQGFSLVWNTAYARTLLRASLPVWLSVIFWILYDNQDVLLLKSFGVASESVGHFAAATKLLDVLKVLPGLFVGVFYPTLSRLTHESPALFWKKAKQVALWLFLGLGLAGGAAWMVSDPLILFLYKENYRPSVELFRILLLAFVGIGLNNLLLYLLIAVGREKAVLPASLAACLSNAAIACLLIPFWGAKGASWALVASDAVFFIFLFKALWTFRSSSLPTTLAR